MSGVLVGGTGGAKPLNIAFVFWVTGRHVSQEHARGGSGGQAGGDLEGEEADQVSAEGSRVRNTEGESVKSYVGGVGFLKHRYPRGRRLWRCWWRWRRGRFQRMGNTALCLRRTTLEHVLTAPKYFLDCCCRARLRHCFTRAWCTTRSSDTTLIARLLHFAHHAVVETRGECLPPIRSYQSLLSAGLPRTVLSTACIKHGRCTGIDLSLGRVAHPTPLVFLCLCCCTTASLWH